LWADGGLALSPAFLELQADLAGSSLRRGTQTEATTRGVAALAAVGAGLIGSVEEAVNSEVSLELSPKLDAGARDAARRRYRKLVDWMVSPAALELMTI
jgi:glycerol kinase